MDMEVINYNIGPIVSKFVAANFVKVLTRMESYHEHNFEQALIETYLKFDELLKDSRINLFLKEHYKKSDILLDVKFETDDHNPILNDLDNYSPRKSRISSEGKVVKEVLTFQNSCIEVSIKHFEESEVRDEDLLAHHMGTTANILFIRSNYLYLANVGDSLAVLYKDKKATKLNLEHKTSLQSEFERINKSGAKIINNRIDGKINLTRALGDLTFKQNKELKYFDQAVTAYPEITKMKITKDMEFIVMGCDGVWDCVDMQKLCDHVSVNLRNKVSKSDLLPELFEKMVSRTNNSI
jgi:serine/threonine protein phosphatase PrpC